MYVAQVILLHMENYVARQPSQCARIGCTVQNNFIIYTMNVRTFSRALTYI